jgi:predicted nuclease of predicted toxin-antitoxin system
MKLLFDENISYRIVKKSLEIFSNSLHVTSIKPKLRDDLAIFYYAREQDYLIVTFDEDFRELQSLNGFPPKIIWFRTGNTSTEVVLNKLMDNRNSIYELVENKEIGILEIY